MSPLSNSGEVIIEATGVKKIFGEKAKVYALNEVNLTIRRNEWVSIVGPSGSGKSTLLNILGCLDKPTEGKMSVFGKDILECTERDLCFIRAKHLGFVFQQFHLLPQRTALENVMLAGCYMGISRKKRMTLAKEALGKVGLAHRESHFPAELSGGERQRVAIARATSSQPDLLLCDEPTGNLDSKSAESVMALLKQFHENGTTIVVITHDMKVANYSQRRLNVIDGKIETEHERKS